jgi:predicted 3-demethylubiquinone-9 3-methyltransferase (glyoxalase superfamily)
MSKVIARKARISPMLWFDKEAEDAAKFYTSIFPNSRINDVTHYTEAGPGPAGSVMVVAYELDGQPFTNLNGGPQFPFTEAISLVVNCEGQQEVDYYWEKLTGDGGREVQCGWLKDRFGVSWQVVPMEAMAMFTDPDKEKSKRAFASVMKMVKIDLPTMRRAFEGR